MDGDVYAGAPRVQCAFSSVLVDVPPERVPRYVSSSEAPGSHLRGNTHDHRWAVDDASRAPDAPSGRTGDRPEPGMRRHGLADSGR